MRLEQKMGSSQFADPNYERLANVQQTGTFLHASHGRYRFNWGDIAGFWRYMEYDLPSDAALGSMDFNGPAVGAIFRW